MSGAKAAQCALQLESIPCTVRCTRRELEQFCSEVTMFSQRIYNKDDLHKVTQSENDKSLQFEPVKFRVVVRSLGNLTKRCRPYSPGYQLGACLVRLAITLPAILGDISVFINSHKYKYLSVWLTQVHKTFCSAISASLAVTTLNCRE